MKTVNPYLVGAVLEPFLLLEEDKAASFASICSNDEAEVRACINDLLVPYFLKFDERSKSNIKDALGYMLLHGSDKWEALLAMNQCPIPFPEPPVKFFEMLWDEIFHQEVFLDGDLKDYVIKEDIHAPNFISRGG
ncbi:hypothetical protein GCM10007907_30350 [Chitinimonas prasina]|uniref:Uncharacterized protein n=1 Tax=Chitinimonas prasina TaxID=1434937 RepID=A0ABQ5YLL3_9NEIS|nr:hypothetical protein [Chitinimonas prasina]GLR14245.1 hypothetical protein GCM10007907_30350 [Chitinimonas prasina]